MQKYLKVPQGKCPLDFLAEQGEVIRNSWIFLSDAVFSDLWKRCKEGIQLYSNCNVSFRWEATKEYPSTEIMTHEFLNNSWHSVEEIQAEDIAYSTKPIIPEIIIFIQMDGE